MAATTDVCFWYWLFAEHTIIYIVYKINIMRGMIVFCCEVSCYSRTTYSTQQGYMYRRMSAASAYACDVCFGAPAISEHYRNTTRLMGFIASGSSNRNIYTMYVVFGCDTVLRPDSIYFVCVSRLGAGDVCVSVCNLLCMSLDWIWL